MKMINHQFHIYLLKDNNVGYDMIIGRDIMNKIGMIVNFNNQYLIWVDTIVPMWRAVAKRPKTTFNRYEINQVM